ncbi:hypothetical protein TVAG_211520 [Trichomonas vaginalis G3]|uniref:Uncharacterized protein n=1 Tax=Trichomonas vaginalis (strain ATCC PRA-98 / G3) TaxID=412133 RepID=A2EKZ2_TRIV3|nr:hypothetical protein TVAGG3_1014020 [Trichomonas vaginalis G3]EAY06700.1 hypothetical protein TVAG_211520 [Trichomonas vaginalis G3]KAI5491699.1 hypothetical protein TVAGG3_1014020 [Trichomonas vaginalis G3]|eukprot:XP_001318923.1 hypothetical protein [Trichomonas vaginalis G3]
MSRNVTVINDDANDDQMAADALRRNFPIPRSDQIDNPCNPYIPDVQVEPKPMDVDKFKLLYHISHAQVTPPDENIALEHTELYQLLLQSFNEGNDENLQEHIIRKYLLLAQSRFFELTNTKSLIQIGIMHGDLLDLAEKLDSSQKYPGLSDFCNMLLGETFDLFSSTISQIAKRQYWSQSASASDLISKVLQRELMNLRTTPVNNMMILSSCLVRRSIESAPENDRNTILEWAAKEHISVK